MSMNPSSTRSGNGYSCLIARPFSEVLFPVLFKECHSQVLPDILLPVPPLRVFVLLQENECMSRILVAGTTDYELYSATNPLKWNPRLSDVPRSILASLVLSLFHSPFLTNFPGL